MPLINFLKLYGAEVTSLLDQGERLLAMGPYRSPLVGDESRLNRTLDELGPRMRRYVERTGQVPANSDRFIQGFDLFAGGLQTNPDRINRWMGGLSGVGAADSIAGQIWRLEKRSEKGEHPSCYAVTDRRLLLLGEASIGSFRILFEVPRDKVASVIRRGKVLFQWGRVEVTFTDGSMKAWTPGMVSASSARALVAALAGLPTLET